MGPTLKYSCRKTKMDMPRTTNDSLDKFESGASLSEIYVRIQATIIMVTLALTAPI